METAEEVERGSVVTSNGLGIQAGGYFLELSLDWIVLRASENIHHLLGQSHVTLIEEPLGRFVHSQPLHDLRNLFSRLSGTTGVGRAYGVRLTDDHEYVDVAFQLSNGRVLLEAVPSHGHFGESFGSVGGLVAGLGSSTGQALLDGSARRMRALTGYDRVTLTCGEHQAESSRGAFAAPANLGTDVPSILCDIDAASVALFPRRSDDAAMANALTRSPTSQLLEQLRAEGVCACLCVAFSVDDLSGEFRCDSRRPRKPNFELHAAAELFAQLFAMQLEIDRFKSQAQATADRRRQETVDQPPK